MGGLRPRIRKRQRGPNAREIPRLIELWVSEMSVTPQVNVRMVQAASLIALPVSKIAIRAPTGILKPSRMPLVLLVSHWFGKCRRR